MDQLLKKKTGYFTFQTCYTYSVSPSIWKVFDGYSGYNSNASYPFKLHSIVFIISTNPYFVFLKKSYKLYKNTDQVYLDISHLCVRSSCAPPIFYPSPCLLPPALFLVLKNSYLKKSSPFLSLINILSLHAFSSFTSWAKICAICLFCWAFFLKQQWPCSPTWVAANGRIPSFWQTTLPLWKYTTLYTLTDKRWKLLHICLLCTA